MLTYDQPSLIDIPHPSTFGVPHPEWRLHQYETVQWAMDEQHNGIKFCEQPTGSGKSAIAKAMASTRRVVVLTHTKNLQRQYGDIYGAHLVMGKRNYLCNHPQAQPAATAEDCLYADTSMYRCSYYNSSYCPYSQAVQWGYAAPFVCTNYAYWLSSKRFRESDIDLLVLDECHLVPETVLNWSGCTVDEHTRVDNYLAPFPHTSSILGIGDVVDWLDEAINTLRVRWQTLKARSITDESAKPLAKKVERLGRKLTATLEAIDACAEDWYVRCGPGTILRYGVPRPGLIIRPLTARYHYNRLFPVPNQFLMSATVGDFDTFAEELGISDYHGRRVPNRYPPEARPVYILDVPRLSHKSGPAAYSKQARMLSQVLQSCPSSWSGIIHVTRKREAYLLKERLENLGCANIYVTPEKDRHNRYLGTQQQTALWQEYRDTHPGATVIAWQLWAGYDGLDEKICCASKVPFPFIGDPYERARMQYSHRFYNQRTAWDLMQALGRTRRGRDEDYDLNGQMNGFVAIADGNWTRVKNYMSEDFREGIVSL